MVKNKEQLEADFRKDFKELLEKHNAELEVTDDGKGYGMHSGIARITIPKEFDPKIEYEFCEFDL